MKKTFCIIGGDERNYELANILKKKGFSVKIYDESYLNFDDFIKNAGLIIGGIPFSRDNETVNAPFISKKISIEKLFLSMDEPKILVGGSFSDKVKDLAGRYDIKLYDFLDDEDFAVYNAIPTAEGAIEIAMRETKSTINSSNCLILGYGRIGKVLADLLNGLHANVIVAARKSKDFAWIEARGYDYVEYSKINGILPDMDIIFNTVPSLILGKEELSYVKNDTLIIDLSSKPGGVDFDFAKEKGIRAELYLGLPGKVAPKSVAEYMLNKVLKVN